MAPKITKLSNPGTDTLSFFVEATNGERFAIDCRPSQSNLARATLRRFLSDYEKDLKRDGKTIRVGPLGTLTKEPK